MFLSLEQSREFPDVPLEQTMSTPQSLELVPLFTIRDSEVT